MSAYLLRLCVSLILSVAYVTAEVTVENGGYSLSVSFAPNVDFEHGKDLVDSVQESLQKASNVLHEAIGLQISKVTFQIPDSWDTAEWNVTFVSRHDRQKADIVIDSTDNAVFGKFPFAQQYGSCGMPGHRIVIPAAFFHDDIPFPKEISLAREWLKYRYGVFDENGYPEDTLYPLFYTTPGGDQNEVHITGCTNEELTYNFVESDGNNTCSTDDKTLTERLKGGECKVQVDENSLENVTSSLMYYEEQISSMQHICGKDERRHNSRSPNKQNTLCFGKSIWETIKESPDFKGLKKEIDPATIEYVFLRESKPKVVIALEDTKKMAEKGKIVLNAVTKFMFDLPDGTKFSAFSFGNSLPPGKTYTLMELSADNKGAVIHAITSSFQDQDDGNVNIAINNAVEILKSTGTADSELEGDIIIITGSLNDGFDPETKKAVEGLSKVCVKIIFLGDSALEDEVKDLFKLPCAKLDEISTLDTDETVFEKLYESLGFVLPAATDDKATEMVSFQYLNETSKIIQYEADGFTEAVTYYVFGTVDFFRFDLTLNTQKETVGKKTTSYTNVGVISYTIKEAGTINLEYPYAINQPVFVQVTATTKKGKYFSGEIVVHNPSQGSEEQMPVIIYAIVRFGSYPLQKAKVSAIIEDPMGKEIQIDMYDDGRGDPDITQNDGIYSRYFTEFSVPGLYKVTVQVHNNEKLTTYGQHNISGYQTCCGSSVKEGTNNELADFSISYHGSFTAVSGRPNEGYKPSRITDLRIDEVTDDKIILKWSAPGGEADTGTVKSYEIKYFRSQEEAMKNFESEKGLSNTETPKERGSTETFEISYEVFQESAEYYIAVKANNDNKTSDLSNTVVVFIPEDKVTHEKGKEDKEKITTGSTNRRTITIIIGVMVAVIVLVIIIYLLIYFTIVKPKMRREKKKKEENRSNGSRPKIENSTMNPVNFIAADTLIRHHNEKAKAKMENKEPPVLKEEDFESKNSSPANETEAENNDHQPEMSNKVSSNGKPGMPPKSPKRTTYV